MSDWKAVYDYLQPKPPEFCPESPSLTQKVFLRSYAIEALFGGAAGGGKLIPLVVQIPTPFGFVKMGDIHTGDMIFGRDGLSHLVLAESEIQTAQGWKLTFDDGASIIANDEHLWLTLTAHELVALTRRTPEFRERRRASRPSRATHSQGDYKSVAIAERNSKYPPLTKPAPEGTVKTTAEIVATLITSDGRSNHAIPVAEPIQLPERELPLDPYVLGAWLGDGSKTSPAVTSMDEDIIQAIVKAGFPVTSVQTKTNNKASQYYFGHSGLVKIFKTMSVLGNKHIPNEYLWASESQRLALLQGLLDTDGWVGDDGSVGFCNTNQSLAEGVAHLARSLGMKVTVRERRATLYGKDCGPAWTIKFMANRIVFRLARKANLQKIASRRTTKFRYIVSAERTEPTPMKCIRVDSSDSLYLASEHFIPTHNSSALLMSALQYTDTPSYSAILFRRTYADLALPGALMDRFKFWMSNYDDVHWNGATYVATFPSGARITFGYLNNTNDYLRYKSPMVKGTDVLTASGWKKIEDIQAGELVASMNPETREWDYQPVTHTWIYDHDGLIYSPRDGSDVSFATTADHTWWVSTQRVKNLRKYRTDKLPKVAKFPQAGNFAGGINPGAAMFPRSARGRQHSSDIIFTAEDWATFLGWFIAEGHTNSGTVCISLLDSHSRTHKDILKGLLEYSGSHVRDNARGLVFTNTKLANWLDEHAGKGSHHKRIPDEVFTWKTKYARLLLRSLVEGDGTWRTEKSAHYVTVSRELADGVMRLAQHCGFRATLNERQDHTTTPDGKEYDVLAFHIFLLETANQDRGIRFGDGQPIVSKHYKGTVHCLTVPPHHTFLTRHNGRVVWTGNSEFQFIGMDEVTEIRESDYRYMFSRLRRPASGPLSRVPLRMRSASNPAPNWVRQRFIVEGKSEDRVFVPSFLTDNPGIDVESYRDVLSRLDPVERRRLEFGDWWATTLGTIFERTDFPIVDSNEIPEISSMARSVRFWDLASTEPHSGNQNPDWTVGTLMLFDHGIAYILDVRRIRDKADKVQNFIARTAYEDGKGVAIRIEQEPGSSGKALIDQYARYVVPGWDLQGIRATGDKITRARPFASAAANGNIRLARGKWLTDWLDELSSFPEACDHDDQVDSAVGAFTHLTGLGLPQRGKATIIV